MSDSFQPHGLQHARLPCRLLFPGVCSDRVSIESIELVTLPNHLSLCCPLFLWPSMFPSIRVFSNKLVLHIRWPKHRSFSFSISPSDEYSGLISFRIDWFDLLAVKGLSRVILGFNTENVERDLVSSLLNHPFQENICMHIYK